jgi:hypothetical protein
VVFRDGKIDVTAEPRSATAHPAGHRHDGALGYVPLVKRFVDRLFDRLHHLATVLAGADPSRFLHDLGADAHFPADGQAKLACRAFRQLSDAGGPVGLFAIGSP